MKKFTRDNNGFSAIWISLAVLVATGIGAYFLVARKPATVNNENIAPAATPPVVEPKAPIAEPPAPTSESATSSTTKPAATVNFQSPYPVSWEDGGASFSLTGVALGYTPAQADPNLRPPTHSRLLNLQATSSGGYYQIGVNVYALTLKLKITTAVSYSNTNCLEPQLRRVINEEGDLALPNTKQFSFANGCVATPDTTTNQEVSFVVPESETEFTVTTGGASNIFFSVKLTPDGKLNVENISAETRG